MTPTGKRHRRGVVAVLINSTGHVLLCERDDRPDSWQFPQGGIEPGETPETTVMRELQEELGTAHCQILKKSDTLTHYY